MKVSFEAELLSVVVIEVVVVTVVVVVMEPIVRITVVVLVVVVVVVVLVFGDVLASPSKFDVSAEEDDVGFRGDIVMRAWGVFLTAARVISTSCLLSLSEELMDFHFPSVELLGLSALGDTPMCVSLPMFSLSEVSAWPMGFHFPATRAGGAPASGIATQPIGRHFPVAVVGIGSVSGDTGSALSAGLNEPDKSRLWMPRMRISVSTAGVITSCRTPSVRAANASSTSTSGNFNRGKSPLCGSSARGMIGR